MVHDCQFPLAPLPLSATNHVTTSLPSPSHIPHPTPSNFSGTDLFYTLIAISVLVRVIVNPLDRRTK